MKCVDKTDKIIRENFLKEGFKLLEIQKRNINKHKRKLCVTSLRRKGKRCRKRLKQQFRELFDSHTCLENEIASILELKAQECVLFLLE